MTTGQSEHTPDTWGCQQLRNGNYMIYAGHNADKRSFDLVNDAIIGSVYEEPITTQPAMPAHANARRIAACVNALKGVPTGALERDPDLIGKIIGLQLENLRLLGRGARDLSGKLLSEALGMHVGRCIFCGAWFASEPAALRCGMCEMAASQAREVQP